MSNLRGETIKPFEWPKVSVQHRLGLHQGMWACLFCLNVYPSARNHRDAEAIHHSHLSAVQWHRDNPTESNLAPDR